MKKNELNKSAFTLAETLIVLVILGVIASITIPGVMSRHVELANRIRIKKAMRVYDHVMNTMTIENGIKDNTTLKNFAGDESNNCKGSSSYFKKVEGSGCIFKTSDGVGWDITDIEKTLISLNDKITSENIETIKGYADTENNYRAFYLIGHFDKQGILRINNKAYEDSLGESANSVNIAIEKKLWNYVTAAKAADTNNIPICENYICKWERGDYSTPCTNDNNNCSVCSNGSCNIYGDDGEKIAETDGCTSSNYSDCKIFKKFVEPGSPLIGEIQTPFYAFDKIYYGNDDSVCGPLRTDNSGKITKGTDNIACYNAVQCNYKDKICNFFNEDGVRVKKIQGCLAISGTTNNSDLSTCTKIQIYKSEGEKAGETILTVMENCNQKTGICKKCTGPDCP